MYEKFKIQIENSLEYYSRFTDDEFLRSRFSHMKIMGTYTAGMCFGEQAISKHAPRTSTVVCREDCQVLILTREKFNQTITDHYNSQQYQRVKFLSQITIFQEWEIGFLTEFSYNLEQKDFHMNGIIYKEGMKADQVYIILSGEVEISKAISLERQEEDEVDSMFKFMQRGGDKQHKNFRLKISIHSRGQVFGDSEIIQGMATRINKAICVSEKCELLLVDRQRYQEFCMRGERLQKIEQLYVYQQKWRDQREKNIHHYESPYTLKTRFKTEGDTIDHSSEMTSKYSQNKFVPLMQSPKAKEESSSNKKVLISYPFINTTEWSPANKRSQFQLLRVKSGDQFDKTNDFEAVEVPVSKLRKTSSRIDDFSSKFHTKSVSPTEHYFMSPINKRSRANNMNSINQLLSPLLKRNSKVDYVKQLRELNILPKRVKAQSLFLNVQQSIKSEWQTRFKTKL